MELFWKDLDILRAAGDTVSQALVEGSIPLPDGRACNAVLDSSGSVTITSCSCTTEGQIQLEGWVNVDVLCEGPDGSGDLFSFSSRAAFRHTLESDAAVPGVQLSPYAVLQTLDLRLIEGRLELNAIVNMGCHIASTVPLRVLDNIRGLEDLQVKQKQMNTCRVSESAEQTIRIREELSAPGIAAVICASGGALLKSVRAEGFDTIAEGIVRVDMLCRDGNGNFRQINHAFPFSESLDVDTAGASLFGEAEVAALSARSVGEEFGIIAIELQLRIKVYGTRNNSVTLPLDAYAPSLPFDCTYEHANIASFEGYICDTRILNETIAIPSGMPEANNVIFVSARPLITDSGVSEGMLNIEGILFTRILYRSADSGPIYAFGEEVPFTLSLAAPNASAADIRLHASASGAAGGASISVDYTLLVCAKLSNITPVSVVNGVNEVESAPARTPGLVICFAGNGEELFDIAKRFGVTREALLKLNPEASEVLKEGDRLMLLV